ncbi:MAG: hypothetical protein M1834_000122 [Cirrosporium novae-zelandiae]|nr:MAG: hypothetical protein M1834_000122 [Cirrosporium novae-zelandiae]
MDVPNTSLSGHLAKSNTYHERLNVFPSDASFITVSSSPIKEPYQPEPTTPPPTWKFFCAFGCLCLVNLILALDATSISVILPIIAKDLNGTAIEAFWAGTSFLLAYTVLQPTCASLSDVFGRKPVLLVALILFTAGSIVAGASQNFTALLIGRVIQGVGGSGIIALTYVILTDMVTLRDRGKWNGLISMMWAIGSVLGPIIGGAFGEKASWRWVFWINLPFCGVAFIAIIVFLHLKYKPGSLSDKIKKVDWLGTFLFIASLTSFLIPMTWGGIQYPWSSWRTLVPLLIGAAGLIGFVLYSIFVRARRGLQPLIRGSIFKQRMHLACYFATILHGTIIWAALYYLPLYYQVTKAFSPIITGVALFPMTFTLAPASVVAGILITRMGTFRNLIRVGFFLTIIGTGIFCFLEKDSTTPQWVFITLVGPVGLGLLYPSLAIAIQAAATPEDLPAAASMFSFFRALGQTLGVAIGGAVFQNQMQHNLANSPDTLLSTNAATYSQDASSLVEVVKVMEASTTKTLIIEAYVDALRVLWGVMCAFAAIGGIVCLICVQDRMLNQTIQSDQAWIDEKGEMGATDLEALVETTAEKETLGRKQSITSTNSSQQDADHECKVSISSNSHSIRIRNHQVSVSRVSKTRNKDPHYTRNLSHANNADIGTESKSKEKSNVHKGETLQIHMIPATTANVNSTNTSRNANHDIRYDLNDGDVNEADQAPTIQFGKRFSSGLGPDFLDAIMDALREEQARLVSLEKARSQGRG